MKVQGYTFFSLLLIWIFAGVESTSTRRNVKASSSSLQLVRKRIHPHRQQQPQRVLGQNRFPDDWIDDVYHCDNPFEVNEKISIRCDEDTWIWDLDWLDRRAPPDICGVPNNPAAREQYNMTSIDFSLPADMREPCQLWLMLYHPTEQPSMAPTGVPSGKKMCRWRHVFE